MDDHKQPYPDGNSGVERDLMINTAIKAMEEEPRHTPPPKPVKKPVVLPSPARKTPPAKVEATVPVDTAPTSGASSPPRKPVRSESPVGTAPVVTPPKVEPSPAAPRNDLQAPSQAPETEIAPEAPKPISKRPRANKTPSQPARVEAPEVKPSPARDKEGQREAERPKSEGEGYSVEEGYTIPPLESQREALANGFIFHATKRNLIDSIAKRGLETAWFSSTDEDLGEDHPGEVLLAIRRDSLPEIDKYGEPSIDPSSGYYINSALQGDSPIPLENLYIFKNSELIPLSEAVGNEGQGEIDRGEQHPLPEKPTPEQALELLNLPNETHYDEVAHAADRLSLMTKTELDRLKDSIVSDPTEVEKILDEARSMVVMEEPAVPEREENAPEETNIGGRIEAYERGNKIIEDLLASSKHFTQDDQREYQEVKVESDRIYQSLIDATSPGDIEIARAEWKKQSAVVRELEKKKARANDQVRGEIVNYLDLGRDEKYVLHTPHIELKGETRNFRTARNWVESIVRKVEGQEELPEYQVKDANNEVDNGRGGYRWQQNEVYITPDDPPNTVVHELGHMLEKHVPGVSEAVQRFLEYRVGNEEPVQMKQFSSGFGSDEYGRKDNFDVYFSEVNAYYVGKQYEWGATEILSMGLEALYKDPIGFCNADPEYVKFIIGILDGSLRAEIKPTDKEVLNERTR